MVNTASKLEITEQTIFTIHYLLADGLVETRFSGKIRDYGVRIGGSTYIPYEDKRQLETRFKTIISKASQIKNPYEQSFFLLIHISYLQAFCDVNKRTARLSANISLIKNNLVPLSFNDVERDDYASAMIAIYEFQDVRPLLDLYAFSYMRTSAMYDSTIKALGFDEVRVRYREQKRALIRTVIEKQIVGENLRKYIFSEVANLIKKEDQELFLEDVMEDLQEINSSRIVGLGITLSQLNEWIELRRNNF